MKLEKEIDNLMEFKKALQTTLNLSYTLEYYEIDDYTFQSIKDEIKKINSNINTLISMLNDRKYLLEEEEKWAKI